MKTKITYSKDFRPVALTVAGFDPSGGAGVLADVKTFEQNKVYGLAVNTGITIQNDIEFKQVEWESKKQIQNSLQLLAKRFTVSAAKLGLHKNLDEVTFHIQLLKKYWPSVKIVWDPVLTSSSGYDFNISLQRTKLNKILSQIELLTPNRIEFNRIGMEIKNYPCAVLLKGGHDNGKLADDILFHNGKKKKTFSSRRKKNGEKHGSGCVLSSAITAQLAKNKSLLYSIAHAKKYINRFLESNISLIGYHQL